MTADREKRKEALQETVSLRRKSILQDNIIQIQGKAFNDIMAKCKDAGDLIDAEDIQRILFKAHLNILKLTE